MTIEITRNKVQADVEVEGKSWEEFEEGELFVVEDNVVEGRFWIKLNGGVCVIDSDNDVTVYSEDEMDKMKSFDHCIPATGVDLIIHVKSDDISGKESK